MHEQLGHPTRLGLDSQTVFGLHPVEHIKLAAELGCEHVSLGYMAVPWKLDHYPRWSLLDDLALRRETTAALRDTGVIVGLGEGFTIRPQADANDRTAAFDLMAELGAESVGAVSMEPDVSRALDQMAQLAQMAADRGMLFLFEFAPPHTFPGLSQAAAALRSIAAGNARLLIDVMHLFRTGGTIADLSMIEPGLIGYAQLCDALLEGDGEADYYLEASFERRCPGEGELPLADFILALPSHIRIGLEVPMQQEVQSAANARDPIARIVTASRGLLDQIAHEGARVAKVR